MINYPYAPGHRGVDTSIAAAEAFAPKLKTHQHAVFGVVEQACLKGATSDEVAEKLGWDVHAVRSRMAELKSSGKVADSGCRRTNMRGKRVRVYVLSHYVEGTSDAA